MRRRTAVAAALVSAACFGTLAILGRLMYDRGAEPLQLLSWRYVAAALLMAGYVGASRRYSLRIGVDDVRRFAVLSAFGHAATSLCFFFALLYADASVVAILLYTYPAIIVLFDTATGVRLTSARAAALVLTFAGCVLVVDPFGAGVAVSPLGVALGVGAGFAYASFTVLSGRLLRSHPRVVVMTYMFAFDAAIVTGVALVTGATLSVASWDGTAWALLAALVLVPTFAAILLYFGAVRVLGASQAAILSTFEPVFTLGLAVALLGETLTAAQWAGAALVLGGVVIAERFGHVAEEPAVA